MVSQPATDAVPTSPPSRSALLASGTISLPAASSFDGPGFHEAVTVSATVPAALGPSPGNKLVLTLRDSGRPEQACSQQHPLSGCATVDWSDSPSRPNVPPNGVFDNHIVVVTAGGELTLFLREDGRLATEPEQFDPG